MMGSFLFLFIFLYGSMSDRGGLECFYKIYFCCFMLICHPLIGGHKKLNLY